MSHVHQLILGQKVKSQGYNVQNIEWSACQETFEWEIEAAKSVSSERVCSTLQHNSTRLESLHHLRHNLPPTTAAPSTAQAHLSSSSNVLLLLFLTLGKYNPDGV